MEEGEFEVAVPLMSPQGDIRWATVMVQVTSGMTMQDAEDAIQNAIAFSIGQWEQGSDRLTGYSVIYLGAQTADYEIVGFIAGGDFFSFQ